VTRAVGNQLTQRDCAVCETEVESGMSGMFSRE
jgi:hypothetical protein